MYLIYKLILKYNFEQLEEGNKTTERNLTLVVNVPPNL